MRDFVVRYVSSRRVTRRDATQLQDVSEYLPSSILAALARRSETAEALVVRAGDTAFWRVARDTVIYSLERGIVRPLHASYVAHGD